MGDTKDLITRARQFAALAEKATPGPWKKNGCDCVYSARTPNPGRNPEGLVFISDVALRSADHDLIAAAPDMARLLGEMADALEQSSGPTMWCPKCGNKTEMEIPDMLVASPKIPSIQCKGCGACWAVTLHEYPRNEDDDLWRHDCPIERDVIYVARGELCNWCGAREDDHAS